MSGRKTNGENLCLKVVWMQQAISSRTFLCPLFRIPFLFAVDRHHRQGIELEPIKKSAQQRITPI